MRTSPDRAKEDKKNLTRSLSTGVVFRKQKERVEALRPHPLISPLKD